MDILFTQKNTSKYFCQIIKSAEIKKERNEQHLPEKDFQINEEIREA